MGELEEVGDELGEAGASRGSANQRRAVVAIAGVDGAMAMMQSGPGGDDAHSRCSRRRWSFRS